MSLDRTVTWTGAPPSHEDVRATLCGQLAEALSDHVTKDICVAIQGMP